MIAGFEAAWTFFGGVFAVVIPDNMKAIVTHADATEPKLNDAFREYAQARGFAVDPARIRSPRDKPRVERMRVSMCGRISMPENTSAISADCRERAEQWCAQTAGMRIHGTTRMRPVEVFTAEELPELKPVPRWCSTFRPGRTRRWPRIGMCRSPGALQRARGPDRQAHRRPR